MVHSFFYFPDCLRSCIFILQREWSMRVILLILVSLSFLPAVNAQTPLDYTIMNYNGRTLFGAQQRSIVSSPWHKQWQFSSFSGVNAGYGLFNGGSMTVLSAPVGIQLTRRLNSNWYAFVGLSAVPELFNLNSSFRNPGFNKAYPDNMPFNTNMFGAYSRAEAGFMYINNEKTFSISGSVHVDRTSYPAYPSYRNGVNPRPPVNRRY